MFSCFVFENVFMKYFNKHEKEVKYKRTARVDKREPLLDCISKLQELTVPYLLHQFSVCCDTVYGKEFLSQTSHYVLWLDYSQNLALKEKRQVQSAHFSGKQQTFTTQFSTSQITKATSSFISFQMTRTMITFSHFLSLVTSSQIILKSLRINI